jgi:hypothetical protein
MRRLLSRRARSCLGTATQCVRWLVLLLLDVYYWYRMLLLMT